MRLWKNTKTLDRSLLELELEIVEDPALAEVALLGASPFSPSHMPHLKTVFRCGVGVDNIPLDECAARGIKVILPSAATTELIYEETSSFAVHLILSALYSDVGGIAPWRKRDRPALSSRVVLVLGRGNIGRRVISKLEGLCDVVSWDVAHDQQTDLDPLLRFADVLTLHMPLDATTDGWLDKHLMKKLKPGAWIVNTARAAIVKEEDLRDEIERGRLQAAFDVFWEEPYAGALMDFHPSTFKATPHVSSHSLEFLESLANDFRKAIQE